MTQPDNNTAVGIDRMFQRDGLRYWSPGPVPGSVWAIDANGDPVLRGNVPDMVLRRTQALAAAKAHPSAMVVYTGGQLYGIAHPGPSFVQWITPLNPEIPARTAAVVLAEHEEANITVTYGGHP